MRQQLENMMDSYQPMASQERQTTYFVVGDLESLSATALYGSDSKEYDKYVRETIREDDHAPLGEHLNYEVWLDRTGHKKGRSELITNVHIPIQEGS